MNQLFLFRKNMTPIRKLLLMKMFAGGVPISEYTATGNPLSFNTNIVKPLKSLVLPWTPVQSGTGDPSPENVRSISGVSVVNLWQTGKNLYDATTYPLVDNYLIYAPSGSMDGSTDYKATAKFIPCDGFAGQMITLNKRPGGGNTGIAFYSTDAVSGFISGEKNNSGTAGTPWTFNVPSNAKYMRFCVAKSATDIQLELGSSSSSYSPYTGTTKSIVFPALGKNLCPGIEWGSISQTTGEENTPSVGSTTDRTKVIPVNPGEKYTISGLATDGTIRFFTYGLNGEYLDTFVQNVAGSYTLTVGEGVHFIRWQTNNTIMPLTASVQVEKGSTATSYEPYTNTVYGGSLDVTTGVLTVEWYGLYSKDLTWTTTAQSANGVFRATIPYMRNLTNQKNVICDSYKTTNAYDGIAEMQDKTIKGYNSDTYLYVYIRDSQYTELSDFTNNVDVFFVYELATPVTYQLAPTQITSLLGDNVIWSDTNGTNTAVYFKKG